MKDSSRRILWLPLVIALVGALFCFWITLGNELTFCQTAGCSLYEDTTVGGISLWYYGMGTFFGGGSDGYFRLCRVGACFALCALLVIPAAYAHVVYLCHCTACLTVAVLFAALYAHYRKKIHALTR